MATPYTQSLYMDYQASLDEALRRAKQREALSGRPLSPAERAAIIQGVLAPYTAQYGRGLEAEQARSQEQRRMDITEEQMKQQQEAAETAGYMQLASLGLMGAQYLRGTGGTAPASTTAGAGTTTGTTAGGAGAGTGAGAETGMAPHGAYAESGSGTTTAGSGAGGGAGGTQPYGQAGGAGAGGGSWWTTQGRYGGAWYGPYVGAGAGATAGYYASPYGQQAEEGTGGLSRYPYKPIGGVLGGGSRRTGQRLGMVSVGAGTGTVAGGFPYGTAGGAFGGYMQENPETGKRGYQEDWEYRIKPFWQKAVEPSTTPFTDPWEQPYEQAKKVHETVTKPLKKVKFW